MYIQCKDSFAKDGDNFDQNDDGDGRSFIWKLNGRSLVVLFLSGKI